MRKLQCVVVVAALLAGGVLLPGQTATGPIKIGFLVPVSGPYAQTGRDILNGFLLLLDEIGYRAGGREIELIVEDTEAIPAVALTKARKLIESDQMHLMAGGLLSSTGYALASFVDSMRIPMVYPVVSADDLTQRLGTKWIVRTSYTGSQPNHPFGEYAYQTLGYRTIATIALDYSFGWESVGGFQRTFEEAVGRITQQMWTPVSVHDFAPYLAQISRDVDVVYALFLGRSTLQFMRQYEEYGLKDRIPLIGAGPTTDEHALPFMGDEALDVVTALHYSAALDTPANRAFTEAYRARYNKLASHHAESMYSGGRWGCRRHRSWWPGRGPRRAPRGAAGREAPGAAARPGGTRRVRQSDRERLRQASRTCERRAAEHRDSYVPGGLPVLDLQPGRLPRAAPLHSVAMPSPVLVLEHLSRHFGGLKAVDDVSLTMQPGTRHALIGPNGAGKTTLFNVISGELAASHGRISLFGEDVTRLAPHQRAARGIARTFQITKLFPDLTVDENMLLACEALDRRKLTMHRSVLSYGDLTGRAAELVDQFGLSGHTHEFARNLSYGDQRKLEMALSLAGRPRLLLLDEPMAGLSAGESASMHAILEHLDPAIAVLLIEHDMDIAFAFAERVTVLHQGRVLTEGRKDEVSADPGVQQIYLGMGAAE